MIALPSDIGGFVFYSPSFCCFTCYDNYSGANYKKSKAQYLGCFVSIYLCREWNSEIPFLKKNQIKRHGKNERDKA
jgi:hypothetical protein